MEKEYVVVVKAGVDLAAFDAELADDFLAEVGDIGTYSDVAPPDAWTYFKTINKQRNSMPGPNTVPFAAYKRTGMTGIQCLLEVDVLLRSGSLPSRQFNASITVFGPKGDEEADVFEVIRGPLQTRPLSLKNTDNKLIVGANTKCLEPDFKVITHRTQNGFTPGRNFLNNILDMDSIGRLFPFGMRVTVVVCRRVTTPLTYP